MRGTVTKMSGQNLLCSRVVLKLAEQGWCTPGYRAVLVGISAGYFPQRVRKDLYFTSHNFSIGGPEPCGSYTFMMKLLEYISSQKIVCVANQGGHKSYAGPES